MSLGTAESESSDEPRLRHRTTAVPRMRARGAAVRALVRLMAPVLLFVALVAWALSSPPGSSPDDNFHLASLWCEGGSAAVDCAPTSDPRERSVPAGLVKFCFPFHPEESAGCRGEGADGTLQDDERVEVDHINVTKGLYPPVFYAVLGHLTGDDLGRSVVLIRIANAALYTVLLSLVVWAVPRWLRAPTIIGALVTLVPLGTFLVPSTNPSSWALLSATTLWPALAGHLWTTGRRSVILGVLAVVCAVVGAGARADAAVYGVLAVGAVAILWYRRAWARWWHAVVPVMVVVVGALFFLSAGQGFNEGLTGRDGPQPPVTSGLVLDNLREIPNLLAEMFGAPGPLGGTLGWFDTPMLPLTWAFTGPAVVAALFWGMGVLSRRKAFVVVLGLVALWLVPLALLVRARVVLPYFVQPRYVLPLAVMLVGMALLPNRTTRLQLTGVQVGVLALALTVANSAALHQNVRRYVTGMDVEGMDLDRAREWWWAGVPGPTATWVVGTVAMLGVLLVALLLARSGWGTGLEPTEPTPAAAAGPIRTEHRDADQADRASGAPEDPVSTDPASADGGPVASRPEGPGPAVPPPVWPARP